LLVDLIKEERDIDKQLRQGTSPDDQQRLDNRKQEIENLLEPFRQTKEGIAALKEAQQTASLDPFQLIDQEALKQKKDAAREFNDKQADTLGKLAQANIDLELAERRKKDAEKDVIATLDELQTKTESVYA